MPLMKFESPVKVSAFGNAKVLVLMEEFVLNEFISTIKIGNR